MTRNEKIEVASETIKHLKDYVELLKVYPKLVVNMNKVGINKLWDDTLGKSKELIAKLDEKEE